jgi:hypothetical protein
VRATACTGAPDADLLGPGLLAGVFGTKGYMARRGGVRRLGRMGRKRGVSFTTHADSSRLKGSVRTILQLALRAPAVGRRSANRYGLT